ncbi:adhesion G-protein coupled receptor F2-like [Lethenteron reissneri]|uniref:adhesion G-protein coupled receptor F2-like n=1 Tax=Lethenteron reissneri TaxID=7753 RepID=UPI002AB67ABF|nr:adhesion G-protein coupled receptor F2-like [Lethenteron reissneri]XP_061403830.1 adhesion G-protein coupled receptor F2-like [Lethenteron reissneri]
MQLATSETTLNSTVTFDTTLNATATSETTLNSTVNFDTTLNATATSEMTLNATATTTVVLNTTATTAVVLNTTATTVLSTTMATGSSNRTSSPYAPQDLKVVPVTLTINEVFNSALSDPNSLDYRTMSNRLLPSLISSYQSLGSRFVEVGILNFRPGSVLASSNVSGYSLTDSEVTTLTSSAIDALIAAGVPVVRDFNINGTTTNVTTERLNEILNQSKDLQNQPKQKVEKAVPILLQNLTMQTNPAGGSLTPDSIRSASEALRLITMATQNKSIVFGKQVAESFLVTASNLLATSNLPSWKSLQTLNESDSADLLGNVETFVTRMNTTNLATGTRAGADVPSTFNITSANVRLLGTVLVRAGAAQGGNYSKVFAGDGVAGETAVTIGEEQLNNVTNDGGGSGGTYVVSMLFTTLAGVLPLRLTPDLNGSAGSTGSVSSRVVGSHILSTVVSNPRNWTGVTDIVLRFPLTVASNGSGNGNVVQCTFWDTQYDNGRGGWSGVGCQLTSNVTVGNATSFSCRCNHTTSFSILVSPGGDLVDDPNLSIVSYVGVGISMLSLVAVLAIEAITWRPSVSSGRAARRSNGRLRHLILVNVCTSLLFADVWFIVAASPDALASPALCTAAAFFVHLGYLALFFWMLCEGFLLVYIVVVVFERFVARRLRAAAFTVGYGVPMVIAVVAVAATYPRGAYLRDGACWLDWEHGRTLLAFVVPAFAVLAANLTALVVVLAKVVRRRSAVVSGNPDVNVRLVARSIGVLTPLLGVTWGLGIFAFSAGGRASYVLHYLFAILNSLQGLFILIFNCLLDKEVRNELKKKLGLGTQKSKGTSSTGLDRVNPTKSHSSESREPEMKVHSKRPSRKDSIKFLNVSSDYETLNSGL